MKFLNKKWSKRIFVTSLILIGLPLIFTFNPTLLYGEKTTIGIHTVYHNSNLDKNFKVRFENAFKSIENAEVYNPNLKLEICLNDNSYYTLIMEKLFGKAYGYGFFDKVILNGEANYKENYSEIHGYKWNLEQLIAHEATHCFQFNKYGITDANPVAGHPTWKWEGYAEYASRKAAHQENLQQNIHRYLDYTNKNKESWCVEHADGTVAGTQYFKGWLMTKYCIEIKNMSFDQILKDTNTEEVVYKEMIAWYDTQSK